MAGVSSIKTIDFPRNQYYQVEYPKKQIFLHHTISGDGVIGDIEWWKKTEERVATCIIIDRNGDIYQAFSSKYWAHHLGIKQDVFKKYNLTNMNTKLNQESIGIEIDSWGGLVKNGNDWYNAVWDVNKKKYIPGKAKIKNVVEVKNGFRGFYGFEQYTDSQIQSVKELLLLWKQKYGISLKYNEDMWNVSVNALKGAGGIWAHVSVRPDKSDIFPQENIVKMLKSFV